MYSTVAPLHAFKHGVTATAFKIYTVVSFTSYVYNDSGILLFLKMVPEHGGETYLMYVLIRNCAFGCYN